MSNLQVFTNEEFGQVRMVDVDGKPYFYASDVARALGYTNPHKAVIDHCRYLTKREAPHPQSPLKTIEVNIIPEGDVYRLITHSKLPSAERFERWVFDEVLPTIREHGTYTTPEFQIPQTYAEALRLAYEQAEQLERQEVELIEARPKVAFADAVSASETSIPVGELAKLLKQNGVEIGQNRLFEYLRKNDYLMKFGDSRNLPTQKAMEKELFEIKESTIFKPNGNAMIQRTTKVTGKGQIYFINKLKRELKCS